MPGRSLPIAVPRRSPPEAVRRWILPGGSSGRPAASATGSTKGIPAVAAMLDAAAPQAALLRAMLRVIEETVPVQRIWLDTAENRDTPRTGFSGDAPASVIEVLQALYTDMTGRRGMSGAAARRVLAGSEPFQLYPALVQALPDPPEKTT